MQAVLPAVHFSHYSFTVQLLALFIGEHWRHPVMVSRSVFPSSGHCSSSLFCNVRTWPPRWLHDLLAYLLHNSFDIDTCREGERERERDMNEHRRLVFPLFRLLAGSHGRRRRLNCTVSLFIYQSSPVVLSFARRLVSLYLQLVNVFSLSLPALINVYLGVNSPIHGARFWVPRLGVIQTIFIFAPKSQLTLASCRLRKPFVHVVCACMFSMGEHVSLLFNLLSPYRSLALALQAGPRPDKQMEWLCLWEY